MKISICIPTWEQYGRGLDFLKNMKHKNKNIITESLKTSDDKKQDSDSGTLLDENNIL